ncbi:MFS transporter [Helcobacillus massiliensis]|uniref:MFS transporter n=1 Tax=Helcobacillus massiliensis TaxID=521392 RepID=UPI002557A136|nr:MFS transporter [Helcobacillus massiliensis]MDK7741447.1 MFS transporter [Helcobacillus massiliensis]WOO92431.1 MFS transporter [Helcobacillus massiliensis]
MKRRRYSRLAPDHHTDPAAVRRATAASALGNATEWYDYGVYAVATSYIAAHFFEPFENARLLTLATFAISFLARPIGGLVWGPLGDRLGRKKVLALTIIMMSLATVAIGLMPAYDTIGIWAPIGLVLLRLIQGFSTGGEYGGAATFMSEYAPDNRRGFFGSFLEFGTLGGFALGTAIMLGLETFTTPEFMSSWGWRLPFLVAAPLGFIGLYLRTKLDESPVFEEAQEAPAADGPAQDAPGLFALIGRHWRAMLVMTGLVTALNIVNYTLLAYMPTYLEQQINLPAQEGLLIVLVGEVLMMACIPFAGAASDRFGRKRSWYFSMGGLALLAVPMFYLMGQSFILAMVGFAVLGLLYIPQLATITATFPAMFPTKARFAGFAITYNVATSLFGGTAAYVNDFAIAETGNLLVPAFYMVLACVVGLVAVFFMPETAGASLRGDDVPGSVGSAVAAGSPAERALELENQPDQRTMTAEQKAVVVDDVTAAIVEDGSDPYWRDH